MNSLNTKSGFVTMIGRPNAGKSTLFNAILGEELSIVTPRPQTTWNRISGILTREDEQIIFLDTPGVEKNPDFFCNKLVNTVRNTLKDADTAILIVDLSVIDPFSENLDLLELAKKSGKNLIVVLNKADSVTKDSLKIQDCLGQFGEHTTEGRVIPVSALKKTGIEELMSCVGATLEPGPFYFPSEDLSEKSLRFFTRELIRKQLFLHLKQELPYCSAVWIEDFKEKTGITRIMATILVEKEGQKGIVVGKGGSMIRAIGTDSRLEIEKLLGVKVFLDLKVKVRKGWRKKSLFLKSLGIQEENYVSH